MRTNEPKVQPICNFCLRESHLHRNCVTRITMHNEITAVSKTEAFGSLNRKVISHKQTNRPHIHIDESSFYLQLGEF